jgi:hypothetical protein
VAIAGDSAKGSARVGSAAAILATGSVAGPMMGMVAARQVMAEMVEADLSDGASAAT